VPVDGAGVQLLRQNGLWQNAVIDRALTNLRIDENGRMKLLQNVVRIQRGRQAVTDQGDSGTLVLSADEPRTVCAHGADAVRVYGMAVGNVQLTDGTSYTVANRLCDVLPAIRLDQRNAELFRGYKELNLCGVACAEDEPDSGFSSTLP